MLARTNKTFFISDTHLHEKRPQTTGLLLQTLEQRVPGADALYLLGDVFEYWIGDDAVGETAAELARVCNSLNDAGTKIYFMAGNRDFLLGEKFAHYAGWTLLADPTVINLYGHKVLLMHGDTLCTDDVAYLAFRQQVRDPVWQQTFLSHSIAERINMAKQARSESQQHTASSDYSIMDVNNEAVIKAFKTHGVSLLIHGHTHRPARHSLAIDGKACERVVLGDWHQDGWLIEADSNGLELIELSSD